MSLANPVKGDTYGRSALESDLMRDEGIKLKAYCDTVGKLTIGVGRNLDDVGIHPGEESVLGITKESCIRDGITNVQAMVLLDNDMDTIARQLDAQLPWWRTLSPRRQRVLLNMGFNLGVNGLLGFKNTLGLIKAGRYKDAANGMLLSKWARQVKARAARLAVDMEHG